jgi:hypothetical protein
VVWWGVSGPALSTERSKFLCILGGSGGLVVRTWAFRAWLLVASVGWTPWVRIGTAPGPLGRSCVFVHAWSA